MSLEVIPYTERDRRHVDGRTRKFFCPHEAWDGKIRTCKRRGCPRCGPPWSRDWLRVNQTNFEHFGAPVVMVTITAPGQDRLPWDEEHEPCARRRRHVHSGPRGCRVQQRAAREWSDTLSWRWAKLRGAARLATQRQLKRTSGELGPPPALLERAYEPQKRGVPHLHVVLGYGTEDQKNAAHVFVGELKRLAADYDFGFADGRGKKAGVHGRGVVERHGVELRPMSGEDAARYLANYLTGRNSKKKNTIRENISDPVMPTSLIWLTPALSSSSTSERLQAMRTRLGVTCGTGVTMRWLRRARWLWSALKGRCTPPTWPSTTNAIHTVSAYLQAFEKRPPPRDLEPALRLAREVDRRAHAKGWWEYEQHITDFAMHLVESCMPPAVEPAEAVAA